MPIPPWLTLVLREAPHLVQDYGPAAIAWAREHPEFMRDLVAQARPRPRAAAEPSATTEAEPFAATGTADGVDDADMADTIARLREQVAYLIESADDTAERERAEAWAGKLQRLQRAQSLVSPGRSATERRQLEARVEKVRAEVVAAFLIERIEDAGGPSPSDAGR